MLDINRSRLREAHPETPVRYVRADLFDWRPEDRYDVVFFGFWLSHVSPGRFAAFWQLVRSALEPDGRAFFVDSLRAQTPAGELREQTSEHTTLRQLNDGREVKIFYDSVDLEARLAALSWRFPVQTTENHLLYGFGEPRT